MDDAIKAVEDKLTARARIREKKVNLHALLKLLNSVKGQNSARICFPKGG